MNGDFLVNVEEVKEHIAKAEIFSLFFPFLGKALIVDTRTSPQEGPFLKVLPMAGSVEERMWGLKKMRPNFPRPRSLVAIPWPRYVASLRRLGVWQVLTLRLTSLASPEMEQDCEAAFSQLLRAEGEEMVKAVSGEGYHTLWKAKG